MGPFAIDLFFDLRILIEGGYISEEKQHIDNKRTLYIYRLTLKGKEAIKELIIYDKILTEEEYITIKEIARKIKEKWIDKPLYELLKYVYTNYPHYAENSIIKEFLF